MGKITPPTRLRPDHDISEFRSIEPELDDWLRRKALKNESSGACRTYVVTDGEKVIGFYCIATGAVAQAEAPGRVRRNMPDPVPVIILGRLAVHKDWAGQKIGQGLVKDAILRTLQAAEVVGIRAILVHAKSQAAKDFYERKCGMTPSPVDPMTLMITLEDARRALQLGIA